MILLPLLMTEEIRWRSKKSKGLKKPKRINSPRKEVGSNRNPDTRKGPGLLVDLKIASKGEGVGFSPEFRNSRHRVYDGRLSVQLVEQRLGSFGRRYRKP